MRKIADITYRMTGFTFVRELLLALDPLTGDYSLHLALSELEQPQARSITADFDEISELSIREFGGGWTQFLYLAVEDLSTKQRDRVHFRVRELERDVLTFVCARVQVSEPSSLSA